MQLKNNQGSALNLLSGQIPGVFLIAFILSAIQIRLLGKILPSAGLLYPALLFCSTIVIYCADHALDALKSKPKTRTALINALCFGFALIAAGIMVIFNYQLLDFTYLWLPVVLVAIYALFATSLLPAPRGAKELLVASVVSIAVFYPLLNRDLSSGTLMSILVLWLICAQNMIVFGLLEKEKDDLIGNFTVFRNLDERKAVQWGMTLLLISSVLVVVIQLLFATGFPLASLCSLIYILMIIYRQSFKGSQLYRIVADFVLVFLIL